jgi:hypothetical protein
MKIIHEIINRGKGSYGEGEEQLTRNQLLRIYDEATSVSSLILTTNGTSGAATYNSATKTLNIPVYTQSAVDGFVPYTGAISNLNLSTNQLITDAVQLSLLPVSPIAPGKLKWNNDFGTLDIGMGYTDLVQKVGMDTYYPPVKNQTGSTITKGTVLMSVGTVGASGRILVAPAVANGTIPSRFMLGIAASDIINGADGLAIWFGEMKGFNTVSMAPPGETWVNGDVLWINPAIPGKLTKTEPFAPNLKVSIAQVLHAATNGIIVIRPSLGSRLTDLHDVNAFTPSNGDLISRVGDRWESMSLSSLGIATVAQIHNPVSIASPANGMAINSSQVLSIATASSSQTGALSSTDWAIFNGKQNQITGTKTEGFVASIIGGVETWAPAPSGSKWSDSGSNIFRNSRVLVGGSSFDGTIASLEVSGNHRIKSLLHHEPSTATITSATTISLSMSSEKSLKRYLLQANLTINFTNNLTSTDWAIYTFVFKQDDTGNRVVTWNTTGALVTWQGSVVPLIAPGSGEITVITIIWTGQEYLGIKSCGF